jgi:hypothetical protein
MGLVNSERRSPMALKSPVPQLAARARSLRDYAAVAAVLLLAYAGDFRLNPLLSWMPVNLTGLGAALTGVGVLAVAGRSTIPRGTGPVLALWALFMPAAILHAPGSYADGMVTYLYTFTILCALGPLFLMRSEVRQKLWVIMQIIFAAVLTGGALLSSHPQLAADSQARVYLTGSNTINSGDTAAVVVLSCFILALTRRRTRGPMLALGGAAAVTMFAIGSRGPVLAIAVALATVASFAPASGVYRTVRITAITLVLFLVWYFVRGDTTGGAGRIAATLLAGSDQDITSQLRLSLWREAWDVIPGHFWGLGWGGLSDLGPLRGGGLLGPTLPYPHDIWLQVTAEAGWIAGAALIVFVLCSLRRLRRLAASPYPAVLFGMAVFWVIQASLSGDPNSFRCMWISLAISWVTVGSRGQGEGIGYASGVAPFGFDRDMMDLSAPEKAWRRRPRRARRASAWPGGCRSC